ncbi:hypothetical protein RchiOBHm_Chr2g0097461 [Rosa chinensis]|uniref:Uncharacterized protein n=1 Tax=Rosa chinensis TaxID=74649 RepID=A0A2P6RLF1_ROSCH|nr:hypothetical protein RchiOBHm_Chr2g0097461 [Rosa chinensis]
MAEAAQMEDNWKPQRHGSDSNGDLALENGSSGDAHDQLVQMVTELKLQNEFLKSQIEGFRVERLRQSIESLNSQLEEEKQTRAAAEEALKHLREEHLEADSRAQDLSAKLAEAQQKLDQEIKEREEKYSDLDSKFTRLHKRAKQRIQDVQKEKDDIEARFREVNERAERALSQQSALQQELDKTRQQANDALKAIDAERQQLRSANNKLRDNLEELRNALQPKESAIEALQHTISEKDQMLEDMRGLLQAAEEKRQSSLAELSAKHQKNLESLEAQLADASSDRNKATETISSLQSKIAEMEAASTGEAARLRAAAETVKGELAHLKHEHEKEKESWEAASRGLKTKLEVTESNRICAEIEVAKMRSQLESEVSAQTQMLDARDAELATAKEEINRLKNEFSSYKVRAHALLQKKDADLAAAKDSEQVTALEEALKEAEKEVSSLSAERDKALQDLQDALTNYNKELAERDAALNDTMQQIKSLEKKLESTNAHHRSAKEAWEVNLSNLEETWRARCETLRAQNEASSGEDIKKNWKSSNYGIKN